MPFSNTKSDIQQQVLIQENQDKSQQDSEIYYINDSDLDLSEEKLERLKKSRKEFSEAMQKDKLNGYYY